MNLQVKYGLIRLISQTADLCDQLKNVDQDCPVKKGETKITKDVDLPNQIPPVSCLSPKDERRTACANRSLPRGNTLSLPTCTRRTTRRLPAYRHKSTSARNQ